MSGSEAVSGHASGSIFANYIDSGHIYTNFSYAPGIQGSINSLTVEFDFDVFATTASDLGQGYEPTVRLLVEQGGKYFESQEYINPTLNSTRDTGPRVLNQWLHQEFANLTSSDFSQVVPAVPFGSTSQLDFTATGAPIFLGISTTMDDDVTGYPPQSSSWGLDNFAVQIDNG